MTNRIAEVLSKERIMIIDGSMSTALEHLGASLNSNLWTAKALAETPELVKQVHIDYFKAGADCGITCSYQATIPGLMANGYSFEESEKIIVNSVKVFREARDEWWESEGKDGGRIWPLCLAGIGPYGAYLSDGSEFRGNYSITDGELYDFHFHRMELLWNAGPDLLLLETIPSLREALIMADIAEKLNAPYWISFSCRDGHHINEGNEITECAEALREDHPNLQMIGINCTKPEYISSLIRDLRKVSSLPIGVYPNSGEVYDPLTKTWSKHSSFDTVSFEEYAYRYMVSGASAVGGCCTTVGKHIREVVKAKKRFLRDGGKVLPFII